MVLGFVERESVLAGSSVYTVRSKLCRTVARPAPSFRGRNLQFKCCAGHIRSSKLQRDLRTFTRAESFRDLIGTHIRKLTVLASAGVGTALLTPFSTIQLSPPYLQFDFTSRISVSEMFAIALVSAVVATGPLAQLIRQGLLWQRKEDSLKQLKESFEQAYGDQVWQDAYRWESLGGLCY